MSSLRPLLIGHRGAPGYRPEHSASSYELAFAMGVDAVEPDVVATRDGVLVVRHENEISGTTDIADRPEFASRRATKVIDGESLTGWFTEDFTWDELATLTTRERIPGTRPASAAFDGTEPILRLCDLLAQIREASSRYGRPIGLVLEIKHATYFATIGLDLAPLVQRELADAGWLDGDLPLVIECFELDILQRLSRAQVPAQYIFLLEAAGAPADEIAAHGSGAATFASFLTPTGLDSLVGEVDGISVDKSMILTPNDAGQATGPAAFVADAHERELRVFTWTARPENRFLLPEFRTEEGPDAVGHYRDEWAILAAADLDGIFVDHADLGVAFFRG